MTIAFFILLAIALGMGIAMYFQLKSGRVQAEEQQQLLSDYQHRVDEQQKLLDDYRSLEKNFNNVGEGYEQALLAFDKMQEDLQHQKDANETLEKRSASLQEQLTALQTARQKYADVVEQVLGSIRQLATDSDNQKLMLLIAKIEDLDDIEGQQAIERTDNIMVDQVADEAIKLTGIDKVDYLTFEKHVAPDAAATMLSTNLKKSVRALTHLLDNALKFTTAGSVTLHVAVDMDKMVAIYSVEDTGEGIPAADVERIFEPYVKLNQFFDGQGIGLTVARSIARRLGGDLVYESIAERTGSRFVLTLPI